MKNIFFIAVFFFSVQPVIAQYTFTYKGKEYKVLRSSKFKDESGKKYDYTEMTLEMMGGEYELLPIDEKKPGKGFLISRISKEETLRRAMAAPKPAESKYFKTGKKFKDFGAYDINGNWINTKKLRGKVIVLNFWFTTCPPCQKERPYLNKIVDTYRKDSNVVFYAIALDSEKRLIPYMQQHFFKYDIIPNGREVADSYGIHSYPLQCIIDKEGKIVFHTVSYYYVTDYWMRKTIDEALQQ
ncbi:MAG: TlpA disulfide reductase family protein [Chitinophagaceae bacterium]|nr:TlpA family protein disulfide reductase [Chitinophagaceae bacterium]MCB0741827.1 TlpA family protein disulfide reductase [Chitinophagaceae bacterium]HQU56495.1 TlpA disulfide reductase family protein [Chitinophagaceae bacterium]HQV05348.1 TlpA disulfide reductase family protein [Chitinophagaceae bacterium]